MKTKQDQLLRWCKSEKLINSVQIEFWGIKNYYIRARRTVRNFVEQGLLKRLTKEEMRNLGTSHIIKDPRVAFYSV